MRVTNDKFALSFVTSCDIIQLILLVFALLLGTKI